MKSLLFLLLVTILACSKHEVNSEQNIEGVKSSSNTSTENISPVSDRTTEQSVNIKEHKAGEPIELYDLINSLLPDVGEDSKTMKWESLNDITSVNWENKFYDDVGKVFKKYGKAFIEINGEIVLPEVELVLEGGDEGYIVIWLLLDNAMEILNINKYLEQMKPVPVDILFPQKHFTSKLIKENTESSTLLEGLYEVKFPSKLIVWVETIYSRGTRIEGFTVTYYTDKSSIRNY